MNFSISPSNIPASGKSNWQLHRFPRPSAPLGPKKRLTPQLGQMPLSGDRRSAVSVASYRSDNDIDPNTLTLATLTACNLALFGSSIWSFIDPNIGRYEALNRRIDFLEKHFDSSLEFKEKFLNSRIDFSDSMKKSTDDYQDRRLDRLFDKIYSIK